MQISRRDALMGATAAAVVTGATVVPLAIKAAGVKVALVSASDARIFALVEEHERAVAEMEKAGERWFEAVMGRMPPHLRNVPTLDPTTKIPNREFWDAANEAWNCPEVEALGVTENRLRERCQELVDRLSQTEAMTLQGMCAKFRIASPLRYRADDDLGDSVIADLERLAGEVRS